ncbi:MAG TPA: serine protease [Myxococcaceae bacterium]|nr:serine protease [Myxococcaceae bacterium]
MIALALPLAALLAAQPAGRPSNAVLRRAYQAARSSTVQVIGPKASGTGIIVGAAGEVLTSPQFVGLNDAKVLWDGGQVPARVAFADARLKVALVEISAPGTFPSVAVKLRDSLETGSWVIGVVRPLGKRTSVAFGKVTRSNGGQSIFAEAELALPPGTPVFDEQSRLIGLAVERSGKRGTRILPLSTIKAQLTAFLSP